MKLNRLILFFIPLVLWSPSASYSAESEIPPLSMKLSDLGETRKDLNAGPEFSLIFTNLTDHDIRLDPRLFSPPLLAVITSDTGILIPNLPPPLLRDLKTDNIVTLRAKGSYEIKFFLREVTMEDNPMGGWKVKCRYDTTIHEYDPVLGVWRGKAYSNIATIKTSKGEIKQSK